MPDALREAGALREADALHKALDRLRAAEARLTEADIPVAVLDAALADVIAAWVLISDALVEAGYRLTEGGKR